MAECSEQWLREGNCDLCRRKKYCSKACKAHKNNLRRQVNALVAEALFKRWK